MKKGYIFTVILLTFLFVTTNVNAEKTNQEEQLLRDTLITLLNPTIKAEIIHYYGYPKQYGLYDAKILDIKREEEGGFSFSVKIQVTTFEAAHNPPYGIETMTISITPSGTNVLSYTHRGDKEEQKIKNFYNEVMTDIKQTFNLHLTSYKQYTYDQLRYLAEVEEEYKTLYEVGETIAQEIINPSIQPPYKNVVYPVTYINGDIAFILFKKADGTNVIYEVKNEKGIWKVVNKKTNPGKRMKNELLWYM